MIHLAWGNLGAEEAGADETEYGDSREDDNMLVASPRDGKALSPALQKTVESHRACYEEDGDKHRRKKSINHNTAIRGNEITSTRGVLSERRCKGRGKNVACEGQMSHILSPMSNSCRMCRILRKKQKKHLIKRYFVGVQNKKSAPPAYR